MYANKLGRFTSPDPLLSSGRSEIPSSWNRYSYVLNNPLRFTDPLGLYEFDPNETWTADEKDAFRKNLAAANKTLKKIETIYGKKSEEYLEAQKAVASYGCEAGTKKCTDRSVVISKTDTTKDITVSPNGAKATRIDNDTRVRVTFDQNTFKYNGESSEFAAGIAHEGVHVSDHKDYISSGMKTKVTDYESERVGYVVESAVGHIMQTGVNENSYPNSSNPLFDPSWRTIGPQGINSNKQQQIQNIRNERTKRIDNLLANPPYNLTKTAPGNSYFQ